MEIGKISDLRSNSFKMSTLHCINKFKNFKFMAEAKGRFIVALAEETYNLYVQRM
jgi:hypothetical protein